MEKLERLHPAVFSTWTASRICIIKPSSLGDVVQALPLLSALRARFPRAHIAWLANRSYACLLRPISILNEVIEFDRDSFRGPSVASTVSFARFLGQLKRYEFDLAIDLQGLFRSGLMCWATRAKKRIGLLSAREGSRFFCTDWVDDLPKNQNAVLRYWRVAEQFGIGDLPKTFALEITETERQWASEQLAGLRRPILAINAGARWETKRWPAERFAESVGQALVARGGGSAVIIGGPGEEAIAQAVGRQLNVQYRDFCGKTTLRQLAALLGACDLLLTNDSGPMHLAAAVGIPTVSIFTCTLPDRAAPFGDNHRHLQTKVWCRGSYLKKCQRMECLADLPASQMLPILDDALSNCAEGNIGGGNSDCRSPKAA